MYLTPKEPKLADLYDSGHNPESPLGLVQGIWAAPGASQKGPVCSSLHLSSAEQTSKLQSSGIFYFADELPKAWQEWKFQLKQNQKSYIWLSCSWNFVISKPQGAPHGTGSLHRAPPCKCSVGLLRPRPWQDIWITFENSTPGCQHSAGAQSRRELLFFPFLCPLNGVGDLDTNWGSWPPSLSTMSLLGWSYRHEWPLHISSPEPAYLLSVHVSLASTNLALGEA